MTGAVTGLVGDISAAAQELAGDGGMAPFIKAISGSSCWEKHCCSVTGQVLNPNMELLFQGPTLRTVNFNFKLCPRELDEAGMCRNIIKFFKRNMALQLQTQVFSSILLTFSHWSISLETLTHNIHSFLSSNLWRCSRLMSITLLTTTI